jgi:division/cell wall cluster transcriptional repressor MraZ
VTRKTQYGWMAAGGLMCLCGVVVALKLREGPKAVARDEPPRVAKPADAPPPPADPAPAKPIEPPIKTVGAMNQDSPPLPPVNPLPAGPPPVQVMEPPPPDRSADAAVQAPSPVKIAPFDPDPPPDPPAFNKPQPVAVDPPPFDPPPPPAPDPSPVAPMSGLKNPPAPPVDAKNPAPPADPKPADPLPPPGIGARLDGPPAPPVPDVKPPRPDPLLAPTLPKGAPPVCGLANEPPLAAATGTIQTDQVRSGGETLREIARRTLGSADRWADLHKLNRGLDAEAVLNAGTVVRLPAEACVTAEDVESVKPLPGMRPKAAPAKVKSVMPLTGTFPCTLDDKKSVTLPRAIRDQLGDCDMVLVSPGPDQCLWLTNQAHLDRLAERLEHSPAQEVDVRVFKRLYYAQTDKAPLSGEGRVMISDRLAQFAGLGAEVVLVGIDDHFELWDAARWRQYTQQKSAKSGD